MDPSPVAQYLLPKHSLTSSNCQQRKVASEPFLVGRCWVRNPSWYGQLGTEKFPIRLSGQSQRGDDDLSPETHLLLTRAPSVKCQFGHGE